MTPELIQALSGIGLTGGCILALWAFGTGKVVTGAQLAKSEAACNTRITKLEDKLDASAIVASKSAESNAQTIMVLSETLKRIEARP